MQYYEYLDVTPANYQSKTHISKSGNCIFNVGIWVPDEGHELDALLQVSIDGLIWANYQQIVFSAGAGASSTIIQNLDSYKGVRIFPEDGGDIFNFAVSEYFRPINLRSIGG